MKYFAKWLPIDGKPEIGDWVDDPDLKEITQIHDNPQNAHPDTKVVKLFLCSRDIQVGDKILTPTLEKGVITHWDEDYNHWRYTTSSLNSAKPGILFKVIGRISLDATWVMDGDHFEETSIKIPSRNNKFCNLATDILIKGPCGHFH